MIDDPNTFIRSIEIDYEENTKCISLVKLHDTKNVDLSLLKTNKVSCFNKSDNT